MFRFIFCAGVLWISPAVMATDPHTIKCTAQLNSERVQFLLTATTLTLTRPKHQLAKYNVLTKEVRGAGEGARDIVTFAGGKMSFHDTYGCISQVSLDLDDLQDADLENIHCVRQDGPPCGK